MPSNSLALLCLVQYLLGVCIFGYCFPILCCCIRSDRGWDAATNRQHSILWASRWQGLRRDGPHRSEIGQ
jgi:hypothetical protein